MWYLKYSGGWKQRVLSILPLNWHARAGRSQKDGLGLTKNCHSTWEVLLTKVLVFYHYGGSKWYINDSYACSNTWVRVIYASFDPPLEIVSVREIFKNVYPLRPLWRKFFLSTIQICVYLAIGPCVCILHGQLHFLGYLSTFLDPFCPILFFNNVWIQAGTAIFTIWLFIWG